MKNVTGSREVSLPWCQYIKKKLRFSHKNEGEKKKGRDEIKPKFVAPPGKPSSPVGWPSCPRRQSSSFKCLADMFWWKGGWWAEFSSYGRVMGDVRWVHSSACSPWLCRNIQSPVCQWPDLKSSPSLTRLPDTMSPVSSCLHRHIKPIKMESGCSSLVLRDVGFTHNPMISGSPMNMS